MATKKIKRKVVSIEVETTLSNKDVKSTVRDALNEYDDDLVVKQIQVNAVEE